MGVKTREEVIEEYEKQIAALVADILFLLREAGNDMPKDEALHELREARLMAQADDDIVK